VVGFKVVRGNNDLLWPHDGGQGGYNSVSSVRRDEKHIVAVGAYTVAVAVTEISQLAP
jgi:hypothetical protein